LVQAGNILSCWTDNGAVLGVLLTEASTDFGSRIGADAVDNILNILASSMLAVTTFSPAGVRFLRKRPWRDLA
jgi:hypothetical protein